MNKTSSDEKLFQEEQQALQTAQSISAEDRYQANELLPALSSLTEQYDKLLRLTRKIFRISDNQGKVLHQHQTEMQTLLDNANQGFLTFGPDLRVGRQYSAECGRIFQRNIAGVSILELMAPENDEEMELWRQRFADVFAAPGEKTRLALNNIPSVVKLGELDIRVECKYIFDTVQFDEQPLVMMMLTDITEILKAEQEIHFLSFHDKLTGLYNRAYVERAVQELIQQERLPLSIIVADMNGLKIANDMFGHEQGDRLLVAMAEVLVASCRETDILARWGGDEFLVVLPDTGAEECRLICDRILAACATAEKVPIQLSAALGAATGGVEIRSLTDLFSQAEDRMYHNKQERNPAVHAKLVADFFGDDPQLTERFFAYLAQRSPQATSKDSGV
jgi:diguanylate cyclase (GGDEF)-like protein